MAVYKDKARGTWYVSFQYMDWTGKKCRKLKRGFITKKQAQEWERQFLLIKAASIDMTFKDFFKVYENDIRPKIRENTWLTKEYIVRTKLMPYFENKKMVDITARDIVKWQNIMLESRRDSNAKYAPTYLRSLQSQLSCMFNHAIRLYDLPSNPVTRAGSLGEHDSDEMLFWTKEEYLTFIPHMANKIHSYLAFEILYWTVCP